MKGGSVKLVKGSARYRSAVLLFGQEYVDKLLADAEAKEADLDALGVDFKALTTAALAEQLLSIREILDGIITATQEPDAPPDAEAEEAAEAEAKQFGLYARTMAGVAQKSTGKRSLATHYYGAAK